MPDTIVFPKGAKFFNVEGVPVVVTPGAASKWPSVIAFDPGKPPRPFPITSVKRNGSPVSEAEFRIDAGLPSNLPDFAFAPPATMRASQGGAADGDGIPVLTDSDQSRWKTSAAIEAARLAAAAIARAARH